MTRWGRSAVGGIADALASPRAWLVALAAALIRGGIVALLLPVVVLPTTTGLAIVLGPVVASVVLGGPTAEATGIVAAAIALGLVWLVAGGLVAATADVWLDLLVRWSVGP